MNSWPRAFRRTEAVSAGRSARHALGAQTDDHLVRPFVTQRLAEQITLDGVAAEIAHALEILGGLDAFGGDRHAEALGGLDDRLDDPDVFGPGTRRAESAPIDLSLFGIRLS